MEISLSIAILFLVATFLLNSMSSALRSLGAIKAETYVEEIGPLFFYQRIHYWLFKKRQFDLLFFALICAKNISRIGYAMAAMTTLYLLGVIPQEGGAVASWLGLVCALVFILLLSLLFGDFLPRNWAGRHPPAAITLAAIPGSLFLVLLLPLFYPLLRWSAAAAEITYFETGTPPPSEAKEKILDFIYNLELPEQFDATDEKLLRSVMTFKGRFVREIMVPRISICGLPADVSIQEAATLFIEEGFSRMPIYKDNIDNIVGIVYFKDIFRACFAVGVVANREQVMQEAIETLAKPVFYTPETRKLSHLLQEFRHKQSHLAIVVDEYGGTEGIVTIEDILEEIVGEIADEYDEDEEELFVSLPSGGWIVDARMNINDIEDKIGLKIPHEGEYDTIGGYIFHRAGAIPSCGLKLFHDDFEIEVLSTTDRTIEKIKVTPRQPGSMMH